ncbi:MAG: hypothetical protein STHCBS139747_007758 [Sporothrix thermara]
MGNKRKAEDASSGAKNHGAKIQKVKSSTVLQTPTLKTSKQQQQQQLSADGKSSRGVVIPATPGAVANTPVNRKDLVVSARDSQTAKEANNREQNGSSRAKGTQQGEQQQQQQQQSKKAQAQQQPSTLPLEPHAAILSDLQPKYNVRTLSVISSTRMEKRIKAVLEHLANASKQPPGSAAAGVLPGIVLLHARATDANKLISVVEVVKRRMREGYFNANTGDSTSSTTEAAKAGKKKKARKTSQLSNTAWYQYNRIYDVASARTPGPESHDDIVDDSRVDQEDDGFAPMVHRFEDAINAKKGPAITTYLSIFLSRTPVVELQKNPEFGSQSSIDPLEVEYQQWMANA